MCKCIKSTHTLHYTLLGQLHLSKAGGGNQDSSYPVAMPSKGQVCRRITRLLRCSVS